MDNVTLKFAIQKNGRLTASTISLLQESGLRFNYGEKTLRAFVENLPVEILFLRDDDIPEYVQNKVVHAGIVGFNIVVEKNSDVDIIKELGFGSCRLSLAVSKEVDYRGLEFFRNKTIATSYPRILSNFFAERNIPVKIENIKGSVEIAVSLGLADAIFDVVSTGSTLTMNGLKEVEVVMKSEAVLIAHKNLSSDERAILEEIIFRFESVLNAKYNRYIMLNCPKEKVPEIVKILPGIKSPTVMPLAMEGWCSLHSVINENDFWKVLSQLKEAGAQGILVIPIEKMVI